MDLVKMTTFSVVNRGSSFLNLFLNSKFEVKLSSFLNLFQLNFEFKKNTFETIPNGRNFDNQSVLVIKSHKSSKRTIPRQGC